MNMNDTFSWKRFGWLLSRICAERPSQTWGVMGLSLVITFIVYGMTRLLQGIEQAQNAGFMIGLIIGGPFLASSVFNYFTTNASGFSFLTLPASVLEKWLTGALIGLLYFFLFLLFFRIMDLAFVAQYHHSLDPYAPFYKEQYEAVHTLSYTEDVATYSYAMFFNFSGMMLIGALYFNKAAFIKTSLVISAIIIGAFLFNLLIVKLMINNTQSAFPLSVVWISVGKERAPIGLPAGASDLIKNVFRYILPVILWSLSLLRLKEKEF